MQPGFEEKAFENAFNGELGATEIPRRTFAPGQKLENRVGVDVLWRLAASNPFWRTVWLANRSGLPTASWLPAAGLADKVPTDNFNLFIQYKRAEIFTSTRSTWRRHFGGSYYRFKVNTPTKQLQTLQNLEGIVGRSGHVLYVAPALDTVDQLYQVQLASQVVANSVVVRPSSFGTTHTAFNFKPGYTSLYNPEPEDGELVFADKFFARTDNAKEPAGIETLIEQVSSQLSRVEGWSQFWDRAQREIPADIDIPRSDTETVRGFLQISTFAWAQGLTWRLLEPYPTVGPTEPAENA
ncbi:hypothetical protein C5E11_00225 [Clavibacter michiganensis]|nr:hypothetical protein C5E11_00225 [Clavibacter michiganensis]